MTQQREQMVQNQIVARGIEMPAVLEAMRAVPRHEFVPGSQQSLAYADGPLSIGHGQTISQPYIVALMTELLDPRADDRILEIGTGSGYQAAILAHIVKQVYSMEIVEPLCRSASETLAAQGYHNVQVICGDGYRGLPESAPFDGIIVTAAPPHVPPALMEQLAVGAKLVLPVGSVWGIQHLKVIHRTETGFQQSQDIPVRFVPMTGEAQSK